MYPTLGETDKTNVQIWFYSKEEDEGLYYAFRFSYGDKPLFNQAVMKSEIIKAYEYKDDYFIPFLEKLLRTNKPDHWEPIEPDIMIDVDTYKDQFEFIIKVDGHQLRGIHHHGEDGPAIHISINRGQLNKFIEDLKNNYKEFNRKNLK